MPKILLVEDDDVIREIVKKYLLKEGYEVIEAIDGASAIDFFNAYKPNLIILDLNLPFVDGLTVAKKIKKIANIPILMLTARTTEVDEINGFKAGADDYVKKPFSPHVLILRVKKLLENTKAPFITKENIIRFKTGELDLDSNLIKFENQDSHKGSNKRSIQLTPFQSLLLKFLLLEEKTLTREKLLDLTNSTAKDPRVIDAQIKNLRKIIPIKDFIVTIRGKGYKINNKYIY